MLLVVFGRTSEAGRDLLIGENLLITLGILSPTGTAITDNAILRGDGTTAIQGSPDTIDDNGTMTIAGTVNTGVAIVQPASHSAAPAANQGLFYSYNNFPFYKNPTDGGIGIPGKALLPTFTWLMPFGPPNALAVALTTANTCVCKMFPLTGVIAGVDHITFDKTTAADADDVLQLGVFSLDGAVQHLQATVNANAAAGIASVVNSLGTPPTMIPGDYWLCVALNNTTPTTRLRSSGESLGGAIRLAKFSQTCTNGVIPATLTTPTKTWINTEAPEFFVLTDE